MDGIAVFLGWQELLRLDQVLVDLVKDFRVVCDILFFNHALKRGVDLLGERVDALA